MHLLQLLGEKLDYYCSSSEDEGGSDTEGGSRQPPPLPEGCGGGVSANTGPKGVLNDWQRYKQLESEKREEAEKEMMHLAKKLSLHCRSRIFFLMINCNGLLILKD